MGPILQRLWERVGDANLMEDQILKLIDDDEMQDQKGICGYLLTGTSGT